MNEYHCAYCHTRVVVRWNDTGKHYYLDADYQAGFPPRKLCRCGRELAKVAVTDRPEREAIGGHVDRR